MESPGFINPAIGAERARGPMTRTNSEIQREVPSMEGPYSRDYDGSRTETLRDTNPGTDGALRKVKKASKPKRKESKKLGEKKKEILAEVMIAGGLQQDGPEPTGAPDGEKQ